MRSVLGIAALSAAYCISAPAQQFEPAPVIQVIREVVKEGRGAAHERAETDYVRAFRKAKSKFHYLALSSASGANEAWFIVHYPSFAGAEAARMEGQQEPLKSELEAAETKDGALRDSSRSMWAVYRPDMSYRADKLDVGKVRFVTVGTYRVRLGKDEDFMAGAKSIIGAYGKADLGVVLLCYQVVSGAPSGTYLFFSPLESMKSMDEAPGRQKALTQAMGQDNYRQLIRGSGDTFLSIESNLYAVSPSMSYVSKATEDSNPGFWKPKPAAKPAAPAKEKPSN